jgi:hypothetical protein
MRLASERRKRVKKILVFFIFCFLFGQTLPVFSEEAQMDYRITANLPDNQRTKDNTYFDLQITPGKKQTIAIEIENTSNQTKKIVVEANDATTSDGITIAYSRTENELIANPKFSQIITKEQQQRTIELAPNEKKNVTFDLTYPKEEFAGYVLGGIHVYEQIENQQQENQTINFYNHFAYSIAVKLQTSDEKLTPELTLGKIKLDTENNHPIVKAELSNPIATMIDNLAIDATISKDGKTIETYQSKYGKVAPNSMFHLIIPLSKGTLAPGTYHFSGKATAGDYHWEWEQDFEVAGKDYQLVEKENVAPKKTPIYWLILAAIVVFILLLLLVIIYIRRKKEKHNDEE